ncbi:response regulator [Pseudodesulfovibrio sp. JC047]|uniref:response regulator transcription factor n=1 Tax=Pseudodesulfovibrio sp. JC047 TaxID=2683199 RepID=UPI0013D265D5|nr:response regulator [Pseudodesulfovibrio sp. JC047]NDV18502.1 response regulator [Pseudodesulfovibrio sp. JC047]
MKGTNKIRLLIVDDETGFADVLRKRMERRGVSTWTASSGEEAIRIVRNHDFDIAIVDLKLEGMDGLEILKVFKLLVPQMPIIMLTGHGCEVARAACLKNGAAGYLSKPFDFNTLLDMIVQQAGLEKAS